MVYSRERPYVLDRNKTKLSECFFNDICIKLHLICSNTVSNAFSKCKQIVYKHEQARKYIIACLFCNIKRFWAYLATEEHDKDKL